MLSRALTLCILILVPSIISLNATDVRLETLRGAEITPYTEDIVNLCNDIYREYPYLYNGDKEGYTSYLESLSQSNNTIICLAFDGKKTVGIAAGTPMLETRDHYKKPLIDHGHDLSQIFYMGEFGLLPEYKGYGLEKMLYLTIEDYVKKNGSYQSIYLYEIDDSDFAEKRPQGYVSNNKFWNDLGYIRHPELNFTISWANIGDTFETSHLLVYSIKNLQ